jgi:hypothetical protein
MANTAAGDHTEASVVVGAIGTDGKHSIASPAVGA